MLQKQTNKQTKMNECYYWIKTFMSVCILQKMLNGKITLVKCLCLWKYMYTELQWTVNSDKAESPDGFQIWLLYWQSSTKMRVPSGYFQIGTGFHISCGKYYLPASHQRCVCCGGAQYGSKDTCIYCIWN